MKFRDYLNESEVINEAKATIDIGTFGSGKDAEIKKVMAAIKKAGWSATVTDNKKDNLTVELDIKGPKNVRELIKKLKPWDIVNSDFKY